jgi:hypothetical protein
MKALTSHPRRVFAQLYKNPKLGSGKKTPNQPRQPFQGVKGRIGTAGDNTPMLSYLMITRRLTKMSATV